MVPYGTYAGADFNLTLSHSRLRSSAVHPNYKEKGVEKVSPIGWAHLYLSDNVHSTRKRTKNLIFGNGRIVWEKLVSPMQSENMYTEIQGR
jgi:hypothetical protein